MGEGEGNGSETFVLRLWRGRPHPSLLPVGEGACFFCRGVSGMCGDAKRDGPAWVCPFMVNYSTYVLGMLRQSDSVIALTLTLSQIWERGFRHPVAGDSDILAVTESY